MPKKNQIAGLVSRPLAGGGIVYQWKATPKLRAAGWTGLTLGSDFAAAATAAIARNHEVDEWRRRGGIPTQQVKSRARMTVGELIEQYRGDPSFTDLKPKTQACYRSLLSTIELWAEDGTTLVRHIDRDACVALRNALVKDGRKYRTAGILGMLRTLLGFAASQNVITGNPAKELNVPEPPARKHLLAIDQLGPLLAAAEALELPHIALGVVLGFYTVQREGDLLATTAFRFRAIDHDISAEARRALAGADGRVLALWLVQAKTETPVAIPLFPTARVEVEAAIAKARAAGSNSLSLFQKAGITVREHTFQRDFRKVANKAAEQIAAAALAANDPDTVQQLQALAEALTVIQFRDLRRSGMCWMRSLGVPVAMIASISGHSIEKTMKILDTYMPRDTRSAAEGMAIAVTRQAERDAADQREAGGG